MEKSKRIIKLLRIHQWYKNLVIFLALIFSENFLNFGLVVLTFKGFFVLSLISSANYVFNDIADRKRDRLNADKKGRPIASGNISVKEAFSYGLSILLIGFFFSYLLGLSFLFVLVIFFANSILYTLIFRQVVIVDVISVAVNFLIRAFAGAVLIGVVASHYFIIGIFFLALFLVLGKRYGEISLLSKQAYKHRAVLRFYSKGLAFVLLTIVMAILILCFVLYSLSSVHSKIIWTLPLFLFAVLRFYYLTVTKNKIVRSPDQALKDVPFALSSLILMIILLILIALW